MILIDNTIYREHTVTQLEDGKVDITLDVDFSSFGELITMSSFLNKEMFVNLDIYLNAINIRSIEKDYSDLTNCEFLFQVQIPKIKQDKNEIQNLILNCKYEFFNYVVKIRAVDGMVFQQSN